PGVVFDRTPLDYLAYMAATGADPSDEASAAALRPAFASLDLLVITLITPETERVLPAAEMPRLRAEMNDALLELVYHDSLTAGRDMPVLELSGPLDSRLDAGLAALDQSRRPRPPGPNTRIIADRALPLTAPLATPHPHRLRTFRRGLLVHHRLHGRPL